MFRIQFFPEIWQKLTHTALGDLDYKDNFLAVAIRRENPLGGYVKNIVSAILCPKIFYIKNIYSLVFFRLKSTLVEMFGYLKISIVWYYKTLKIHCSLQEIFSYLYLTKMSFCDQLFLVFVLRDQGN